MHKKTNKNNKKNNRYPMELPSRGRKPQNAPIVDNVVDNEAVPMNAFHPDNGEATEQIAEVVAAEIDPQNKI